MRTHYHTLEQGILLLVVGDVRLAGPADVGGVPADAHRQSDVGRICPRLRLTWRYHCLKIRRFFVIIVNSMLAKLRRLTLCVIIVQKLEWNQHQHRLNIRVFIIIDNRVLARLVPCSG